MKLIFSLLLGPIFLLAQNNIKEGYVLDSNNEPLAFVSVIVQSDVRSVVFSDIDGHFNIPISGVLQHITFRYIGFTEVRLTAPDIAAMGEKPLRVVLESSNLALNTVDIVAGENPADILMRKVIANRHRNNPERNGAYTCKTYNKVSVDALPNRAQFYQQERKEKQIKSFEATEADMQEHHLFFMESVTERSFLAPNFIQEKVLLNRVSGFKDAALVTLANAVQPFTFYGDFLPLMDKKFVNPVSPGSTKLYFFSLADTLFDGTDTIWVVQFKPRKGKVFMGLKGSLHIHSNQYAVQNVIAYPAFGNENLNMTIEQAYVFIPLQQDTLRGQWFPQQLNFELHAARYPSPVMGMKATGHSYISEAAPNIQLSLKDFNPEQPLFIDKNAFTRDSLSWLNWQKNAALTSKEIKTYRHLDSLGAVKHFDQAAKAISALSTQVWPLYKGINLHLGSLLRLNEYEQIRLGLGFTNAQHRPLGLSKRLEWGMGTGYGIRDQQWKYNAYGLWRLHRGWHTHLRLSIQRDLLEPGAPYEMNTTTLINRSLYAQRMDISREAALRFSSRVGRVLHASVTLRHQEMTPAGYVYSYQQAEQTARTSRFIFDEITVFGRWAYGEQLRRFLGNNTTVQRWPVVELAATHSIRGYQYRRYLAAVYQSVFIPRVGYCQWRLEAGWANGDLPLAKLFTLNQNTGNYSVFAVSQTFQALPDTLFLHNRFANLFFEQELGPVFYQKKYSAPTLSLLQNIAIGQLDHPEQHKNIGFLTMQKPYVETGVRLDNLLRINYVNLGWIGVGGAVFYRWGALSNTDWRKNITPRLSVKFTL